MVQYGKLVDIMLPVKHLLSSKAKFTWTDTLDVAFKNSKDEIMKAIINGVQIFDLKRRTCLRPDWSKTGIGYYLSQKHCDCKKVSPDCCKTGWKITLVGSRFLKPADTRFAPVEGEALAIT